MRYASLRQGLVGAWCPSLGPSGNTLIDRSGHGRHIAMAGTDATAWASARYGWSLSLDGADDVGTTSVLPAISTQGTQSLWFRRSTTSVISCCVGVGVPATNLDRFILQPWSDGNLYVSFSGSVWGFFATNDLLWHHVLASYDGGKSTNADRLRVWFDGFEVSLSFTGSIPATIGSFTVLRVGQTLNGADQFSSGQIDDYRIYDRAIVAEARLLGTEPGIGLKPERTSVFFGAQLFNAAWAKNSNQLISAGVI